jgi:hypothetical protein
MLPKWIKKEETGGREHHDIDEEKRARTHSP